MASVAIAILCMVIVPPLRCDESLETLSVVQDLKMLVE